MIESIILLLQVLLWPLCLGIVGLILLQGGAGDLSSAFGGGGALDSTLGVGASKKMAKVTGWMAGFFFAFVLFLAIPNKGGLGSALKPEEKGSAGTSVKAGESNPVVGTAPEANKPVQPVVDMVKSTPQLVPAVLPSKAVIAVPQDAAKQVEQKVEAAVAPVAVPVVAPIAPAVAVPAPVVPAPAVAVPAPIDVKPADAAPAVKPAQ